MKWQKNAFLSWQKEFLFKVSNLLLNCSITVGVSGSKGHSQRRLEFCNWSGLRRWSFFLLTLLSPLQLMWIFSFFFEEKTSRFLKETLRSSRSTLFWNCYSRKKCWIVLQLTGFKVSFNKVLHFKPLSKNGQRESKYYTVKVEFHLNCMV